MSNVSGFHLNREATLQVRLDNGTDREVKLPSAVTFEQGLMKAGDGSVLGFAVARTLATNVTATGLSRTGACQFAGIFVSAYSGGPQTITARDSIDATGRIIGVWTVSQPGYFWLDVNGFNSVSASAGVHLTISGGTSRTVCAVVEV